MTILSVKEREELKLSLKRRRSSQGLSNFLNEVYIELSNKKIELFKHVKEPFQDELLLPLIPAIESSCGLINNYTGPRKFFYSLPKSHSKTTLIGLLASWSVCFSPHHSRLLVAAGDQKQANFTLEAIQMILRENQFLNPLMKIIQYRVQGPGGFLTIESSDSYSKSGVLADIILLDEICFWSDTKGKQLFDVLEATTVKRPSTVLIIITNAGILNSWQYSILKNAFNSDNWIVNNSPGIKASWLSEKSIIDASKNMIPSMARRVFYNIWAPEFDLENSYLSRDQILSCIDNELSHV